MSNPTKKQATIYDIAKEADVTAMTVSRVLSGKGSVSAQTRRKVLEIAKRCNYASNSVARSLKSSKTNQILFATPWIREVFNFDLISSVQSAVQNRGYSLLLAYTEDTEEGIDRVITQMLTNVADGLIFMTSDINAELLQKLDAINKPIVLSVVAPYERGEIPFDYVGTDTCTGIRRATEYFIGNGHREIGYIGMSEQILEGAERLRGFCHAMEAGGLEVNPRWVFTGGNNEAYGFKVGTALSKMERRPSAIVAATDLLAMGVYKAFEPAGILIPDDIAIIGMDNIEFDKYLKPNLASVAIFQERMGEHAVDFLINRIEGIETGEAKNVAFEPRLIVRGSAITDRFAGRG